MNVHTILKLKGADVLTIGPDQTIAQALSIIEKHNIGALVVSADKLRVLGILSERDIVRGLAEHGRALMEAKVETVMTREVYVCEPDDSIAELMSQMTERRIRHLPVVIDGKLAGIVSIGDVVKNRLDEVESEKDAMREYIARG